MWELVRLYKILIILIIHTMGLFGSTDIKNLETGQPTKKLGIHLSKQE